MTYIIAILLYLGIVNSPDQATDEVIAKNKSVIEETMNDKAAQEEIGAVVIHILEDY